jgi:hypothetical protein
LDIMCTKMIPANMQPNEGLYVFFTSQEGDVVTISACPIGQRLKSKSIIHSINNEKSETSSTNKIIKKCKLVNSQLVVKTTEIQKTTTVYDPVSKHKIKIQTADTDLMWRCNASCFQDIVDFMEDLSLHYSSFRFFFLHLSNSHVESRNRIQLGTLVPTEKRLMCMTIPLFALLRHGTYTHVAQMISPDLA